MSEKTLSIIKPDAVRRNLIGRIYTRFEDAGFKIVAARMIHMSEAQAKEFYAEHAARPFFAGLVKGMTSGPILVQVLEADGAILKHRTVMGATNPKEAAPGTIRADYAISIDENSVHGSDSATSAAREIAFFFKEGEIHSRHAQG